MSSVSEAEFEAHIAGWLVTHGGYRRVKIGNAADEPREFDAEAGVDTADLFEFVGATQGPAWERLVKTAYGADRDKAQAGFTQRLAAELDRRGTVDVLRRGVVDRNVTIQLAYFRPAHGLTPELAERYGANVLSVTRWLVPRGGVHQLWGEGVQARGVKSRFDLGGSQHGPGLGHPRDCTVCED